MAPSPPQVFTSALKARTRLLASVAIVLASAVPFAAGLFMVTFLLPEPVGVWAAIITAGALLSSAALTWLVQDRSALLGNAALRERLKASLLARRSDGPSPGGGLFAGFSPGSQVLIWEGETDLDVGFLHLGPRELLYVGDTYTWSLARERVDRVELTPAHLGPRRVVVHWHAPREAARALTLESREARSLSEANTETAGLFRRLRQWSVVDEGSEEPLSALGYPPTDQRDGRPVDELGSGSCLATLAMTSIILLTVWYLVGQMLRDGFYYHAVLWAGFVFVGGAVFTRCLLHYLQSVQPPRAPRPPDNRRFDQ